MFPDTQTTIARLTALRDLGVRIAIDDFGTGYSSLGYLRRFQVDILKIAREFIATSESGPDGWAFASAIVALGRTLGLRIIAEGIEDADQLRAAARDGLRVRAGLPVREGDAGRGDGAIASSRRSRAGSLAAARRRRRSPASPPDVPPLRGRRRRRCRSAPRRPPVRAGGAPDPLARRDRRRPARSRWPCSRPSVAARVGDLGPPLYVASTMLVGVAILRNWRMPGMPVVVVGAACNLAAIVANGGFMPAGRAGDRAPGRQQRRPPGGLLEQLGRRGSGAVVPHGHLRAARAGCRSRTCSASATC